MKKVIVESEDIKVIKRDRTYATVRSIWDAVLDALPEEKVVSLYERMKRLTEVDEATKQAHIQNINRKYKRAEGKAKPAKDIPADNKPQVANPQIDKKICPRCGRELVLRTARKGANAGMQFYGCSGFPSCRYTEKV